MWLGVKKQQKWDTAGTKEDKCMYVCEYNIILPTD